jgi:Molydopterin dinucleotide binding domain
MVWRWRDPSANRHELPVPTLCVSLHDPLRRPVVNPRCLGRSIDRRAVTVCRERAHQIAQRQKAHRELPAPWVDRHIEGLGGWRLAPRLLVDQLHALREPARWCSCRGRSCAGSTRNSNFSVRPPRSSSTPTTPPAAGVCDEQRLIVRSALGELTGVARVDASVRRGAVSVPHGHAGANVKLLTSKNDIDLVTGMTRYSGVSVSLHPA